MTTVVPNEAAAPQIENDARVNPRTGRPAGALQGALLLAGSCLPVLGAVLLSPVLPSMQRAFADTPGADALVPLVLTVPALFIGMLAPVAGIVIDKVGRKRVLIVSLLVYAVLGTAPLWIDALPGILISRMLVGVAEAFLLTACTTLIADYFFGRRRDRYLGLQAMVTAIAATVFFAVGGALGAAGWRAPFWLYLISVVIAVAMVPAIWPTRQASDGAERVAEQLPPLRWRALVGPSIVTIFGGLVFYTLIVELPYLLNGLGVTSTAQIGVFAALASLATAIGALLFRWLSRSGARVLIPGSLLLVGLGQVLAGTAHAVAPLVLGAVVAGFGAGVLLPTMITWCISRLTHDQRGRGTGVFTASIFFGEFVCPLAILAVTGAVGGLPVAIAIVGVASIVVAAILALALRRTAPALEV